MMTNTVNRRPAQFAGRPFAEDVTVCVPGSMLAPAPAAEAPPVFVDDSGTRRKLIRATGCILMLLLVGFLGVVGVALALPSVGANVALGNVAPFLIPGAAAKPPAPAPVAFVTEPVQNVAPASRRPAPKPKVVQVAKPAPKKEAPVVVRPAAKPVVTQPVVTEPVVTEPVVTEPVVTAPVVEAPVVTPPATDTTTTGTTTTTDPTKTGTTTTGTTTTTTGTTTGTATDSAAPAAPAPAPAAENG